MATICANLDVKKMEAEMERKKVTRAEGRAEYDELVYH
jgi:hypothetical protein